MWIVCQGAVSRTSGALFACGPSNEWTVHIPECGQSSFCLEVTQCIPYLNYPLDN